MCDLSLSREMAELWWFVCLKFDSLMAFVRWKLSAALLSVFRMTMWIFIIIIFFFHSVSRRVYRLDLVLIGYREKREEMLQ